jgi:hypothetical protein
MVWSASKETLLDMPAVALPGDRWHRPQAVSEFVPYGQTIVAVDPSGRGKDETVAVVMSQINGFIFIRDIFATQDGYSDKTLCGILRLAGRYGASLCLIESNFGDGAVMELMKKHAQEMKVGMNFEEVRATTRKEDRIIDTLEPVLNQHRLVIDQRSLIGTTVQPRDGPRRTPSPYAHVPAYPHVPGKGAVKHDDRVDALALGVKYFADILAISAKEQDIQRSREQWSNMITGFINAPTMATDLLVAGSTFDEPITAEEGGIFTWM